MGVSALMKPGRKTTANAPPSTPQRKDLNMPRKQSAPEGEVMNIPLHQVREIARYDSPGTPFGSIGTAEQYKIVRLACIGAALALRLQKPDGTLDLEAAAKKISEGLAV